MDEIRDEEKKEKSKKKGKKSERTGMKKMESKGKLPRISSGKKKEDQLKEVQKPTPHPFKKVSNKHDSNSPRQNF